MIPYNTPLLLPSRLSTTLDRKILACSFEWYHYRLCWWLVAQVMDQTVLMEFHSIQKNARGKRKNGYNVFEFVLVPIITYIRKAITMIVTFLVSCSVVFSPQGPIISFIEWFHRLISGRCNFFSVPRFMQTYKIETPRSYQTPPPQNWDF